MSSPSHPPRVLVTGGPGFIGRRVVDRFLAAGWSVTSFSLPGEAPMAHWGDRVRMVHGDVRRPEDSADAARDAALIVHLAAVVGLPGEYERQWSIIAEGTRTICRASQTGSQTRTRILVASSVAVYGDQVQKGVCSEDLGLGAWQGAYGRAKQAQETIAQEECAARGLDLTLIRPANVYGLGGSSAWGDRLIDAIRRTGGAVVGDAHRNNAGLVYVENLADAIFLAATDARAIGRTYNVCDEESVTWRQFMDDMAGLAGMPPPTALPLDPLIEAARANENPSALAGPKDPGFPSLEGLNLVGHDNRFPSARIRTELGWRPRIAYADAIAGMRQQMRGNELT